MIRTVKQFFHTPILILEYLILKGIKLYQRSFSPDHGVFKNLHRYGYCKFHPTCSEYTYQSIQKYGLFKGGYKSVRRIFRCTPWSSGGVDHP